MNITLTIVAPEIVGALNNLANAFGNNPLSGVAINADSKVFTADKKTEEPKQSDNLATKTLYFRHDGTDEAIVVKKGESLAFLESDIFDPITKEQYLASQAKTDQVQEPTPEPEENTSGITLDMITTKTREFIQANKANKAKLKEFLEEKGVPRVSVLPPSEYQSALDFFEAAAE